MTDYTLHQITDQAATDHLKAFVGYCEERNDLNFKFDVYCLYEKQYTDGRPSETYALVHTDAVFGHETTTEEIKQVFLEESQIIHAVLNDFPQVDYFFLMGYVQHGHQPYYFGSVESHTPEFL